MKFYILFFISLVLCYCDGTSRRSGGNNPKNSGKETEANTAFWAARGKRNDMSGILKCAFVKTHDDLSEDSDFSWTRQSEQMELPIRSDINTEAWDARFKRSTEQTHPFYLPAWVLRALASSERSNAGNTRNPENLAAWLKLEKKSDKDEKSTSDVPFWAARG